jgi:hypothetical protein
MSSAPVLVYYWIPGDNDENDCPNVFPVPSKGGGPLKLRDIRARFPLPGVYHFRFKMRWENAAVWMDVTNEESNVPLFEEKVWAKVLRVSWDDSAPGKAGSAAAAKAAASNQPASTASEAKPQGQPEQRLPPAAAKSAPQEDMLGFGDMRALGSQGSQASPGVVPRTMSAPSPSLGGGFQQASPKKNDNEFDMLFG